MESDGYKYRSWKAIHGVVKQNRHILSLRVGPAEAAGEPAEENSCKVLIG